GDCGLPARVPALVRGAATPDPSARCAMGRDMATSNRALESTEAASLHPLGHNCEDFADAPGIDIEWSEDNWRRLIEWLIETGFVSAREIGALVLGHLNPSQVGTSIASK